MPDDVALFIEARDGQQRSLADPCGQVIRVVEPALGIGVAVAALEARNDSGRLVGPERANLDLAQARPRYARTAAESLSGVKPKCSASTFQGADAPKPFMP